MRIRAVREEDIEAIAQVHARTTVASGHYGHANDPEVECRRMRPRIAGYFAGTYHPSYALSERTLFLAEQGTKIVGYVAGQLSTRMGCDGELQWMFVLPERQRQGIGARLLQPLAQWFGERTKTQVIIDAPPENPCRAFYLKHGARPLDAYWLHWRNIEQDVRDAAKD